MKKDPASKNKGARSFRQQPLPYDVKLLFPVLFLVGIGIVMVYSASSTLALKKFGTDYFFLKKQAVFALLGIVALVFCRHFPYRLFRSLTYPLLIIALIFLGVILTTGFGYSAGGATRWFRFGGFTFQPSEFARFAMVIYLAYSMQKKKDKLKDFKVGFLPHVLVLGMFTALIIIQPDFGSVAILCALTWIMLFVGGVRISHLLAALVIILPLAYLLMIDAEYRLNRMMSFWNPWKILANAGGIAIFAGCSLMIFDRLAKSEEAGAATYFDWALIATLLIVVITGFATEVLHYVRLEPHRHIAYFIHLVFILALLLYLPYSKFAHIAYRTTAMVYAEYSGRAGGARTMLAGDVHDTEEKEKDHAGEGSQ